MSDIIARLRNEPVSVDLCNDAADYIDSLRERTKKTYVEIQLLVNKYDKVLEGIEILYPRIRNKIRVIRSELKASTSER